MFRQEGPARSVKQNCVVAGYLALVGGYVNCASFVLIGTFTSHVTGNVGRLGGAIALHDYGTAFDALTMVAAFFAGAFLTSMMTESRFFGRHSNAYGVALLTEASLLGVFLVWSAKVDRLGAIQPLVLCTAMGVQNSLVTRLSGAIVRTTHLTGVITDLGIEAARWFRWWRGVLARRIGVALAFGSNPPERPLRDKILLLGTIAASFVIGAVAGAEASVHLARRAMAIPIVALVGCAVYAFVNGRRANDAHRAGPPTRGHSST